MGQVISMVQLSFDREQVIQIMEQIIKRTIDMDMTWGWPMGVACYGISKAYEITDKEWYFEVMKERVDELIQAGLPGQTVNTCAMGHCLITIYKTTKEDCYLDLIHSMAEYLSCQAPRFGDGVLQHTVSAGNDFPEQCWADTLFMAAYFLLRAGALENNKEWIADALNQFQWHIRYLQNPDTGLWYHGYDNITHSHMSGIYWGRANCWAAYTMSQAGAYIPEPYLYPEYIDITGSLNLLLCSLKKHQTDHGLWRTIVDDPDSYEEVSASAGIAAAMASRHNPLYIGYIQKALDGILRNVSEDGKVTNVSGGTAVMNDRDGYRRIPRTWIQGWGQGLTLAFLGQVLLYNQNRVHGSL